MTTETPSLQTAQVGARIQYVSDTVINNSQWTWQGEVVRVTWKYLYVKWTHANKPAGFCGPILPDEQPIVRRVTRDGSNCPTGTLSVIEAI